MPSARNGTATAVLGDTIYVIGGGNSTVVTATVEAYVVSTNTWISVAPLNQSRSEFVAEAINGKIYVAGGYTSSAQVTNSVEEYNPQTNTWTIKASMPTARSFCSGAAINNKLYVAGGFPGNYNILEEYDPVTNTWTTKAPAPYGFTNYNGSAVYNGVMHIIGGRNGAQVLSSVIKYNPSTNTWSTGTPLPSATTFGAVTEYRGMISYLGGCLQQPNYTPNLNTHYSLNTVSNLWSNLPNFNHKRSTHSAATVGDKIYIFGGVDSAGIITNSVEEYSLSATCLSSNIPTNGLVAYYPFCGNANDESGNGNNGVVNGATLTTDRFGNANSAYVFDGVNDFVDCPDNPFDFGTNNFTVSAWINRGSSTNYGIVLSKERALAPDIYQFRLFISDGLHPNALNKACFFIQDANNNFLPQPTMPNGYNLQSNSPIQVNQWEHIVIVRNGINYYFYQNGVQIATATAPAGLNFSNNNNFRIGARYTTNGTTAQDFFNGKIDDIAIYNRALSPQEITNLYNGFIPQNNFITGIDTICSGSSTTLTANFQSSGNQNLCAPLSGTLSNGLLGYWPFCGNANDISGNGNNGSVNGATLTTDRFGNVGNAYSFNNNEIVIPFSSTQLNSNYSISIWAKLDTIIAEWPTFLVGNDVSSGGSLYVYLTFQFSRSLRRFNYYMPVGIANAGVSLTQNITSSLGSWYHLVITDSSRVCKMYVNGTFDNSATPIFNSITGNFLHVGGGLLGNESFKGLVDDLALFNRVLTPQEIQQLYTLNSTQYLWSNGSTTSSIQVAPIQTTSYTCTVTENGQTHIDTFTVNVLPRPIINAGPDRTVFSGSTQSLSATGGQIYNWSNGIQNNVPFTVSNTTTYTVTGTDANGCTATDQILINVLPFTGIQATIDTICNGDTVVLSLASVGNNNFCSTLPGTLSNGLVGYWPFCGNANDISGNGNNGTVNGATLTTDRFGNVGNAYSFDGVNDYIFALGSNSLNVQDVTISGWVNMNLITQNVQGLVSRWQYRNFCPNWVYSASIDANKFTGACASYPNTVLFDSVGFQIGVWYHFVYSHNSLSGGRIYLNGILRDSNSIGGIICSSSLNLIFGAQNDTSQNVFWRHLNGKLDDIAIYNRALSPQEIQQLYTLNTTQYLWSNGATTTTINVNPIQSTNYTCTVTQNGQTSIDTFRVSVLQNTTSTLTQSACSSFTLNGQTYSQSGTFTQVRTNAAGCDSTITLNLTIRQPTTSTLTQSACSSYTLNGQTYSQSGTYTQVRTNAAGCDSTITLNLTIRQPTTSTLTQSACSSFTLNGQTYNQSGTFTQVRTNAAGCDSTITLNLTIRQPTTSTITQSACSSFTLNGQTYNQSGTYTQVRTNAAGCDSTITLNLTIRQPSTSTLTQFACSSYTLNGQTYSQSGTFTQVRTNAAGCDSTITLNLTIRQPTTSTLTQSACSSFTLNGQTYNQSGTYTQVRTNAAGCDSTITLNLTIRQPTTSNLTQSACSSFVLNGQTYNQSGTYTQVRTNAAGCDSTITLNLTIRQPSSSILNESACSSFTLNGQTYNQSGTYTQVRTNTAGCDSTITLNLTIRQPSSSVLNESACSSFTLNGQTYNQSGTFTQVRTNAAGCDSTITLNLTIRQPTTSTLTQSACSSFTLNGQTYNQSGTYTQVRTNAAGCDSTITLNLSIRQPSTSTLTQSACSSFTLNGQTYNQSGTYTQVRTNAAGCDSTITLNLTIRQPSSSILNESACSSFTLNGQTYNQSGTYTQVRTNAAGCDSTITLNLTINPLPQVSISNDSSICSGQNLGLFVSGAQTYQWSPAQSLSNPNIANPIASPIQSTQYYVTATGNGNCQTVDSVLVQVRSLPQLIGIGDTICQGETGLLQVSGANTYSWSPNLALSSTTGASVLANPIKTRTYTVIGTDAFGCQGRTNITLIVGKKPAVDLGPDRKVCKGTLVTLDAGNAGASFLWNTGETSQLINTYNPGIYVVKVSTALGCESRDTVVIVLKKCVFYPDVFAASRPTDVHTWEETEWNVYPNPHENFFIIENGEDMIGEKFKIMDLLGRIVLESKIESTRNQIETGFWPAGIYFIQMESRGELKKLIKKQ